MTPNKERIRKWVDALRSGDYRQGKGKLRIRDQYCCLGVACDVSGLGQWADSGAYIAGQRRQESLPARVRDYYGFKAFLPQVKADSKGGIVEIRLDTLNDDWELNFSEIADAIERTYLEPTP